MLGKHVKQPFEEQGNVQFKELVLMEHVKEHVQEHFKDILRTMFNAIRLRVF